MTEAEKLLGFVHLPTQRTGTLLDGPWGVFKRDEKGRRTTEYVPETVFFLVRWDDTGMEEEVFAHEVKSIRYTKRHITDGVRACWCGPATIDGIVVHRGIEDLN